MTILAVALNPSIDKTIVIPRLEAGGLNRAVQTREDVAGKGINVAAVLKNLGADIVCAGFNFDENGGRLEKAMAEKGIRNDFTQVNGRIRTNLKIFETESRRVTEINESGGPVDAAGMAELKRKVREHAGRSGMVVFGGSAPPGAGAGVYADLTDVCREANPNVAIALDADGELMRNGLKAAPDIIKPNLFEMGEILGEMPRSRDGILRGCGNIIREFGVKLVCVSMGAEGAVLTDGTRAFFAKALDVDVKSATGAGDSMLAGLCAAFANGGGLERMLRSAVAAAGGSVSREGTLLCRKEDYDALFGKVEVEAIHGFAV